MLKELNHVIDYIEDHLTDDLSLDIISEYAGVSDYHFRKIFFYLSGMTLSEYIKNRKLSEANKDLLKGERVTDVAFKYGYQSMDGFTRAFKKWSGFLPSDVIKTGISKSFPKLSFVIIMITLIVKFGFLFGRNKKHHPPDNFTQNVLVLGGSQSASPVDFRRVRFFLHGNGT